MVTRRQLLLWVLAALAAITLLVLVLVSQHKATRTRWTTFLTGDPHEGARIFQRKGCAHCHGESGVARRLGPSLGLELTPKSSLNQLVTAMWNHAPNMWARMRTENIAYPDIDQEEMANLFAYLYTLRYIEEPGDPERGQLLFRTKGCVNCHALRGLGGHIGPDLSSVGGVDTPIIWTQTMWNHAPGMEGVMQQAGLIWPKFEGREMNDLLAYVRLVCDGSRREFELLPADPEHGWQLFQSKSCIACHEVNGKGGKIGPELGLGRRLPLSIVEFAGRMWNHSPQMWRAMKTRGIQRPSFEGREMADLIAFLSSLRYFEPGGSPQLGQKLFVERGCSHCHGASAEGTRTGPRLRGQGGNFTSVTLATALWHHGPRMYERAQELRRPWPSLLESDVSDLVIFLNTPLERKQ